MLGIFNFKQLAWAMLSKDKTQALNMNGKSISHQMLLSFTRMEISDILKCPHREGKGEEPFVINYLLQFSLLPVGVMLYWSELKHERA